MDLNRRSFLKKTLAAGSMLAGTGSILASCSGTIRSDIPQHDPAGISSVPLDEIRTRILYHASLAPSGHNSQPWSVKVIHPDLWTVGIDPRRQLPAVDPNNREALLSLGAFAENLAIAAGNFGFSPEIEVMAQDPFEPDILKITLNKGPARDYPLERLRKRMTVKHGHLPTAIRREDVAALSTPLMGHMHYFPAGTEHANCIREGVIENFRLQAERDDAQKELVQWLRISNRDAEHHRDGLTVAGMEIRGIKGWFVRNFVTPDDFMKPSFRKQGVDHTAAFARQGGGWFVITSAGPTPADLIDVGRKFERMALLARERRIAIHPMTQYLEEDAGVNQIAANHRSSMIPQFLLRVGYLKHYPEPASLRRPVSWFVQT